jgi:hypothetical protein
MEEQRERDEAERRRQWNEPGGFGGRGGHHHPRRGGPNHNHGPQRGGMGQWGSAGSQDCSVA